MSFEMFQTGSMITFGSVPGWDRDLEQRLGQLSDDFQQVFNRRVSELNIPALIVRGRFPCNISYVLDEQHFWMIGDVARGMPMQRRFNVGDKALSEDDVERSARWELGHDDPFFVKLPRSLVDTDLNPEERVRALEAATDALVAREYQRVVVAAQAVRLDPLFCDPPMQANPNLCFVIAPFSEERSRIFRDILKPTVEENGLACVRADDIRTNRAVMENIWRSICEARFLVADLTTANANVFYELGIAHTVGKEVILIEERPREGPSPKRPFDTMGINAIIYENSALGGTYLREEMDRRVKAILARTLVPVDQGGGPQPMSV